MRRLIEETATALATLAVTVLVSTSGGAERPAATVLTATSAAAPGAATGR